MAWDKNNPDGDQNIALGDDVIRDNNAALETAMDLEHEFTTGSGQTGRHHFGSYASQAAIDAVTSGVADGSVAFRTDVRSGSKVWYVWDGATWDPVDCGAPDLPRLDEQSQFTACQYATQEDIAGTGEITPGATDVLNIELDRSSYRFYTPTSPTQFAAFVNDVASNVTTLTVELTQPTPAVAITFDTGIFETAYGIEPVIGTGDAEKTVIQFIKQTNGKFLIVTSPVIQAI